MNTCAEVQCRSLKNGVNFGTFGRKACVFCVVAFVLLSFSIYQLWALNDLILTLRRNIFEYLREKNYRHALEYLEPARSEKEKKKGLFLRKHLTVIDWPVVGRDTFSPLKPALGSQLKTGYVALFRCPWRSV